MTRIAVTGGREYTGRRRTWQILDAALDRLGMSVLIVGACPTGLDRWALQWARDYDFPFELYAANWKQFGRYAGPERNGRMVAAEPEILLAFPGGDGTADMMRQSAAAGVRIIEIDR